MRSGFGNEGLPRQLRQAGADPDMLLLLDSLHYHGMVDANPADARVGDLWIVKTATNYELRAKVAESTIITFASQPV